MLEEKKELTNISDIGEFGLIDFLTKENKTVNDSTKYAIGDDAAVLNFNNNEVLVSTDLLVENVHFDLSYTPLKHLGFKAVAVNVSDIAAMNGIPRQITIGIALSSKYTLEAVEELYKGIYLACQKYKVDLVGGDTTTSKSGLMLSVTVIGEAKNEDITYRKGAKPNDLICVSGDLGGAYAGLLILEREKKVFAANPSAQPDLGGYDYVLERQLKPEARVDIVSLLKEIGVKPTAMIDVSDGLSSEIMHICKQSKTGCKIYEEKIPIDFQTCNVADEFKIEPAIFAMNGGEDYELLFTISQSDYEKVKELHQFCIIGHITEENEGYELVHKSGATVPIVAQGWNPLKD